MFYTKNAKFLLPLYNHTNLLIFITKLYICFKNRQNIQTKTASPDIINTINMKEHVTYYDLFRGEVSTFINASISFYNIYLIHNISLIKK